MKWTPQNAITSALGLGRLARQAERVPHEVRPRPAPRAPDSCARGSPRCAPRRARAPRPACGVIWSECAQAPGGGRELEGRGARWASWRGFCLMIENRARSSIPADAPLPHPRHARRRAPGARRLALRCSSGSARARRSPAPGRCPAATSSPVHALDDSIRTQLARKVDVAELSWLEQLETVGDPDRHPDEWQLATAYLGPGAARPRPGAARRHERGTPSTSLPEPMAFDHGRDRARRARAPAREALVYEHRLRAGAARVLDLGADVASTPLRSATPSTPRT